MRTERTLLRVMSWLPASPSMYTRPLRLTIIPCSSAMRGSGKWISQLAFRPTRIHSAVTAFLVWDVRPPPRGVRWMMSSFNARGSPVDEDRNDVHRESGQQHEGERDVEVEPEIEDRLVAQVAARALQELVLLQQQPVHLLVELRALAGEALRVRRPLAYRGMGRALRIAPRKEAQDPSSEPRASHRPVDEHEQCIGKRHRLLAHFAVDIGDAQHDRLERVLAEVCGHRSRYAQVREDAVEAARDDEEHQHVGEG